MGTITSGIGLVSGINAKDIIDQLMRLESRPKDKLQARIDLVTKRKLAYTELSTKLASLRLYATTLKKPSTFTAATAKSSNENVLTATTSGSPTPGTYQFQVARLVTTQQTVTNGFADFNSTKVGAGTLTIEQGGGELTSSTPLAQLNGGTGVRRGQFRVTDRSGRSALVDISAAVSLEDVVKKINTNVDVSVRASISGDKLVLTDLSGGAGNLTVQDVGESAAAADLGIVGSVGTATLTGTEINKLGRSTLLSTLNDGRGVRSTGGNEIRMTFADGSTADVSLFGVKTVGEAIDAINTAGAGKLKAEVSADGHGLTLTDLTGGGGTLTVAGLNGSKAAADLGIEGTAGAGTLNGKWVLSRLNTVLLSSLNGGAGMAGGQVTVTGRDGATSTVDLTAARTVQDVIDTINAAGVGLTASLKASANGIQLVDSSGGTGDLVIADAAGSTIATQLGIAGTYGAATRTIAGANLQRQWVSENSLLSTYNGGKGVGQGVFTIKNSAGVTTQIDLSTTNKVRLGEVISMINARGIGVTASINAKGDGLLLTDGAGGTGKLTVTDFSGTAAADLNIKGTATGTTIDGSFERTIELTANDTLATAQQKIADLNFGLGAQIINDGSGANPYRLSLVAKNGGLAGRVVFDTGTTGLAGQTLVEAQDAAVFVGSAAAAQPLLITASRNQIAGVINGVNLDLHSVGTSPVTLSISRTSDTAVEQMTKFTEGFNELVTKITELTKFTPATGERGLLLGDATVQSVQSTLYAAISGVVAEGGRFRTLADVGLKVTSGAQLTFDEGKFREAYATDPEAVNRLFTYLETKTGADGKAVSTGKGLGYLLETKLSLLIDPVTGVITRENKTLDQRTEQFQSRISSLDKLIAQKRARLERQFAQMESVLADLQSQQASLNQIQLIQMQTSSSK